MLVPSEAFSVRVESSNGAAHLRLSGRFDVAAVRALDELIGVTQRLDVVMDLGDVTFMDGAAWLAVMDFEHRAHDWGKEVRLINTPSHVRRIFELTATEYLLSDTDRSTNGRHARRTAVIEVIGGDHGSDHVPTRVRRAPRRNRAPRPSGERSPGVPDTHVRALRGADDVRAAGSGGLVRLPHVRPVRLRRATEPRSRASM